MSLTKHFTLIMLLIFGGANAEISHVNDEALSGLFAPEEFSLPPRLFTPELIERARAGKPSLVSNLFGNANLGLRFAQEIPENRWREMLPPYTAFTMRTWAKQNISDSGKCPFCDALFGGLVMGVNDFITNPFQAKTKCCGAMVYEREEDMPEDYKAKPNKTVEIPNLDGTMQEYRFYVPPGEENQGPKLLSRRNWFCSASEVWWARMEYFTASTQNTAVTALAGAVFLKNDPAAARALAVIYDRLAEVLPAYQLVDSGGTPNGIARGAEGKDYLTKEEYRKALVPAAWTKPGWLRLHNPYYNLNKMSQALAWQDGVVQNCGNMAAVFDFIRDLPETKAYSSEQYGDETAWEKKVRKGALEEWHFLAQCSTPNRGGNTSDQWISGGIRLGVVTQDRYFIDTAAEMSSRVIDNGYFASGLSTEGSFIYAAMNRATVNFAAMLQENLGMDFSKKHPLWPTLRKREDFFLKTLRGVESMHGDEHAYFFSGAMMGWKKPPEAPDYSAHEAAQCDPIYGLAALRAGAPGRRMETILDFQLAKGHTHDARLNLQVFYEGINLMPDIGYACVSADISKSPWSELQYSFEKLPKPPGTDFWGAWFYSYARQPELHQTALVDGDHGLRGRLGPIVFRSFFGGAKFGEPDYNAQFVDVEGKGLFNQGKKPVEVFNRQIATITLENGDPLTVDFFRIQGGQRHDLLWHTPATGPDGSLKTSLGDAAAQEGSLNDILNSTHPDRIFKDPKDQGSDLIRRLERWKMPAVWQVDFRVDPTQFYPASEGGRQIYAPWMEALHPVDLQLFGSVLGSPATTSEIFSGRAPWPSKMREVVNGQEIWGTISLKDALHVLMESRISKSAPLESTFVHVLSPTRPDEDSPIQKMETFGRAAPGMGAGLRLDLAPSGKLFVASTHDGGKFENGGMRLQGRFGVAEPQAHRLTLFDGTHFSADGFEVNTDAGWNMKLLSVIGDITGHMGESALLVESAKPLPTDNTLSGRILTVQHQISPFHSSAYTIERVTSVNGNRYRIDLRNTPSFLMHRLAITEIDEKDPQKVQVDYYLLKGNNIPGLYDGRRVRFPRLGFETSMTLLPGISDWHHTRFRLAEKPPTLEVGEPLVIYQIQPGDQVTIPSYFACQGEKDASGLKLEIVTSGSADITIPGTYKGASLIHGPTPVALDNVTANKNRTRL
ncbi:MAG: hypothetical protein ACK5NG_05800, partial [Chthoniobacterales bacterium]